MSTVLLTAGRTKTLTSSIIVGENEVLQLTIFSPTVNIPKDIPLFRVKRKNVLDIYESFYLNGVVAMSGSAYSLTISYPGEYKILRPDITAFDIDIGIEYDKFSAGDAGAVGWDDITDKPATFPATAGGADTQIQFNNAGALAGDSGFTYNTTNKTVALGGGVLTASNPVLNLAQTWNNAAVTFEGIKLNVTNTASDVLSRFATFSVDGSDFVRILRRGAIVFPTSPGVQDPGVAGIGNYGGTLTMWSGSGTRMISISTTDINVVSASASLSFSTGTALFRDAAGILAQRSGVTTQTSRIYNTYTDASNYERLALIPGATSGWMQIAAQSAGTGTANINVALTPAGTGALSAQVPDSTTAGGNARGTNAVDWQTSTRTLATQVASGAWATCAGGFRNTASGSTSVVAGGNTNIAGGQTSAVGGGYANLASGPLSWIPGGSTATTRLLYGAGAYSAGQRAALGDAQVIVQPVRITTSAASATTLTADGGAESATNVMVLPINSGADFEARVVAVHASGAAAGSWKIEGTARRGASGNAIIVGTNTVTTKGLDAALGTPTINVVPATGAGAGAIVIQVTPANATTTYWVGRVELIQAA
jgi:hypothetical protein